MLTPFQFKSSRKDVTLLLLMLLVLLLLDCVTDIASAAAAATTMFDCVCVCQGPAGCEPPVQHGIWQ